MLGSIQQDTFGMRVPKEIGAITGGTYVAVDEVQSHYDRARAAGAEIVQELQDDGFGMRYSAVDLEGHLWVFGDYRPSSQLLAIDPSATIATQGGSTHGSDDSAPRIAQQQQQDSS